MFISTVNYSPTSREKIQMAFTKSIKIRTVVRLHTCALAPVHPNAHCDRHSQNAATRQLSSSASTTEPVEKIQQRNVLR